MKQSRFPRINLADTAGDRNQRLESFALINLGLVQSVASGAMTASDVVECFYHAENCGFVQRQLRTSAARTIMSHGIQLPDLFEALTPEEAQGELYSELEKMRALCLKLLRSLNVSDPVHRASA